MKYAERCYFIIWGILLCLMVNLVSDLIVDALSFLSMIVFKSTIMLIYITIGAQIILFILTCVFSILLVVYYTGQRPRSPRKTPFTSLIVMAVLVPLLFIMLIVVTPLQMLVFDRYFMLPGLHDYIITKNIVRTIMSVLRYVLLSVLAIIVIIRVRGAAASATSTAP